MGNPTQGAPCDTTNVMKQWSGTEGQKTIAWEPSSVGTYQISVASASGNKGTFKRKAVTVTVTNPANAMSSTMETAATSTVAAGSSTAATSTVAAGSSTAATAGSSTAAAAGSSTTAAPTVAAPTTGTAVRCSPYF